MPVCQIGDDQISGKSQHNFHFYHYLTQKLLVRFFLFTWCRAISIAINARIRKEMVHLVSECASKCEYGQFWRLQKAPWINQLS